MCRALISAGIDVDTAEADSGVTLLMQAAVQNDLALLEFALNNGADINRRNKSGESALGFALAHNSIEAAELLILRGADLSKPECPDGHPIDLRFLAKFDPSLGSMLQSKLKRAAKGKSVS